MHTPFKILLVSVCLPLAFAFAENLENYRTTQFPSGMLREFTDLGTDVSANEGEALAKFKRRFFAGRRDTHWEADRVFVDSTHTHRIFTLRYLGRRVVDRFLKTHYAREGRIQYASTNWDTPLAPAVNRGFIGDEDELVADRIRLETKLRAEVSKLYGSPKANIKIEPVWWIDGEQKNRAAFEVEVLHYHPLNFRHLIVDQKSLNVLEEKKTVRFADVTANTYLISPLKSSLAPATLNGITDPGTSLTNGFIHVRREENAGAPVNTEIDPHTDYSATFTTDPATYNYTCTGASCPNQQFDAVNVFFHLNAYRQTLASYFTTLGVQANASTKLTDPLEVLVNSLDVDFDGNGSGADETNNAAYLNAPCTDHTTVGSRCLVFLRPAPITTSACGGGTSAVPFFDLAREGNVVVHEFQHYITDRIAGLISGASGAPNVGDAIHEGYSDYLGTSQVSGLAGTDATRVGEYAFQNCQFLVRDTSILRVYQNGDAEKDPHVAGLSWASGLWELRRQLGRATADMIALKSLFFLPTQVGFVSAVESLVKADVANNAGANVAMIRSIFYDQIKFVGGQTAIFSDPKKGIIEMGFHSCLSVHSGSGKLTPPAGWWWAVVIFALWLKVTLWAGGFRKRLR